MSTAYIDEGSQQPQQTFNIKLPKKAYRLKCIDVVFKRSKKKIDQKTGQEVGDNPMLERTWEVIAPEKVMIKVDSEGNKKEVVVAGLKVKDWLTMTPKTANTVKNDSERFGVDLPDDERPNVKAYINKEGAAILITNEVKQIDEETSEPITDSKGNPVISYQHQLQEWLA
jgi:hypothetical protein